MPKTSDSLDSSSSGRSDYRPAALSRLLAHELLDAKTESQLAGVIKRGGRAGERAVWRLVQANAKLVMMISNEFVREGTERDDLFSVGMIGLIRAAQLFDPAKAGVAKARFASYAAWHVRQQMSAHRRRSTTGQVNLPVSAVQRLGHIRKFQDEFMSQHARMPDAAEIGAQFGISPNRVAALLMVTSRTSLDAKVGESENASLHDLVADGSINPAASSEVSDRKRLLTDAVKGLPAPEGQILARRFGLFGFEEETLEEIAKRFDVTRERIRQIEAAALKRLRLSVSRSTSQYAELAA